MYISIPLPAPAGAVTVALPLRIPEVESLKALSHPDKTLQKYSQSHPQNLPNWLSGLMPSSPLSLWFGHHWKLDIPDIPYLTHTMMLTSVILNSKPPLNFLFSTNVLSVLHH